MHQPSVLLKVPPVISVLFCLLQSLTVDNTKLRDSEKKLIKEKIKLTRTCKVKSEATFMYILQYTRHLLFSFSHCTSFFPLSPNRSLLPRLTNYCVYTSFYSPIPPLPQMLEVERDRAEDRLKIEQTQRDSVERLRQRNKELEEQLRALCESQVKNSFQG